MTKRQTYMLYVLFILTSLVLMLLLMVTMLKPTDIALEMFESTTDLYGIDPSALRALNPNSNFGDDVTSRRLPFTAPLSFIDMSSSLPASMAATAAADNSALLPSPSLQSKNDPASGSPVVSTAISTAIPPPQRSVDAVTPSFGQISQTAVGDATPTSGRSQSQAPWATGTSPVTAPSVSSQSQAPWATGTAAGPPFGPPRIQAPWSADRSGVTSPQTQSSPVSIGQSLSNDLAQTFMSPASPVISAETSTQPTGRSSAAQNKVYTPSIQTTRPTEIAGTVPAIYYGPPSTAGGQSYLTSSFDDMSSIVDNMQLSSDEPSVTQGISPVYDDHMDFQQDARTPPVTTYDIEKIGAEMSSAQAPNTLSNDLGGILVQRKDAWSPAVPPLKTVACPNYDQLFSELHDSKSDLAGDVKKLQDIVARIEQANQPSYPMPLLEVTAGL